MDTRQLSDDSHLLAQKIEGLARYAEYNPYGAHSSPCEEKPTSPYKIDVVETVLSEELASTNPLSALACLFVAHNSGTFASHPGASIEDTRTSSELLLQLADMANKFGFFDVACRVCRELELIDPDLLSKKRGVVEARALRGIGLYEEAQNIYRKLLLCEEDELEQAALLIYMAKLAHSFQWRTGYYRELLNAAVTRLERMLLQRSFSKDDEIKHLLGICYDSLADVRMEHSIALPEPERDAEIAEVRKLMDESIRLGNEVGRWNSILRREFRKMKLEFNLTTDTGTQREIARLFEDRIPSLGGGSGNPRGAAVRLGQLAQMQFVLGEYEEAAFRADQSRVLALKVSDWRVRAQSSLLMARICTYGVARSYTFDDYIQDAKSALGHLNGQHPEIAFEVFRVDASSKRWSGGATQAITAGRQIVQVLEQLEKRVASDYERHTAPRSKYCPAERIRLNDEEWALLASSLMRDYLLISRRINEALREATELADQSARKTARETSMAKLARYHDGVQHRLKNIINMAESSLLEPLKLINIQNLRADTLESLENVRSGAELLFRALRKYEREAVVERGFFSQPLVEENVLDVARGLDITWELRADPTLDYEADCIENRQPLLLECHAPTLRLELTNLVENAARAIRKNPRIKQGLIRVRLAAPQNGKPGIIQVEDNAGRCDELEKAIKSFLEVMEGEPSANLAVLRRSGLYHTLDFFRAYNSRVSVSFNNPFTVLRIEIERTVPFHQ
jgi:hypothetical protein